jgi:transaldolase/glucose-6-phosphate isomerase
MNALRTLQEYGQSVWLDYIRCRLIESGDSHRLVQEDGLRGVTSNPAIFEKAVTGSNDYTRFLEALQQQIREPKAIYERLAVADIQDAADVLISVSEQLNGRDGFVSLEISPYLAHDMQATVAEARRLWKTVGRDNVMIKVPATPEGIPAIGQLISEGINVNVTLLFSQEAYEQVADAYLTGLERRLTQKGSLRNVASVASFFVSRIDTAVDSIAMERLQGGASASEQALLRSILGRTAIANAKLAYQRYKQIYRGPRWQALAAGAQRRSACCGPARARRTPDTATCCTWRNSSGRTRSTPCARSPAISGLTWPRWEAAITVPSWLTWK